MKIVIGAIVAFPVGAGWRFFDIPMPGAPVLPKREVIGQLTVCSGCRCGVVDRGKPEAPRDWLKQEWRSRGLQKDI